MSDIVDAATRSRMMAGIRGKNTRPEIELRKSLFSKGLRYRINVGGIPGKPDIVFPRYDALVFVHGCFWHGHDCSLFSLPSTRREFWLQKIEGNRKRDVRVAASVLQAGWRLCEVWECAIRGRMRIGCDEVADEVAEWVRGSGSQLIVRGKQ